MGDKDDLLDHFFSAAYHDDFVEHQQQYYQHQPLNESGNQEYRPMKSSNSSRKTLNRTNSSTMNNTKKSAVTINRASSSVKTLTTNPAKSKAKSTKKKKKRLMKQDEAITKRLIEKWKENDVDDEGLKILFNQVDVAFPQYVPEDSGHKFRNSGNVKGNSPPRIPDSNALRNHTRNSSTLSKGNNMTNSKEMFVGNPKTTDMKTDDVVRWIDLRDNYLTQLRTLFSSLNDEDLDDTIQKKSVTLLMLLAALRKISIRIVSTFEIVCLQYNNKRIKTKVDTKMLIEMTDYIRGMASSLDWMGAYNEICQSFLHINPILNPFLSIQRIDGLSALYGNESHGNSKKNLMRLAEIGNIPFELTLSEDELEHCAHLGYIIYTLHNNNTTKTVQEMKNESKMFEDFTKPKQTDFLYRDPYEMQNNLTDQNNSNINNLKDDVTNTVIEKDLFDEMSSPTYFLNNEVDESVLHKPNRIENEQENPTINYFSEQFNEKRNLDKQRMYHGNSSPPPEDVATVDVRFATTDMNGHARNGPSNVVLHSNVTKFHTNETPGMRKLSGCKPDALSLHQVHATNPTEEDGVAVRRLGNRVSAFGNNFEKDDDVVAVHVIDMYKLRFAWKYWRREFLGIEKIKPFIAYREKKIKQKVSEKNIYYVIILVVCLVCLQVTDGRECYAMLCIVIIFIDFSQIAIMFMAKFCISEFSTSL